MRTSSKSKAVSFHPRYMEYWIISRILDIQQAKRASLVGCCIVSSTHRTQHVLLPVNVFLCPFLRDYVSSPFQRSNCRHRSIVYHAVLMYYLASARDRGFKKAQIWSCAATIGLDYIFRDHPANQKFPENEQLCQW